jgi:hypothetical protein
MLMGTSNIPSKTHFGIGTWLFWLIMNTVGISLSFGILLYGLLIDALRAQSTWGPELVWMGGLTGVITGFAGGFLLGIAQWLVLRRHIPRAFRWVWRTAIGFSLGLAGWLAAVNLIELLTYSAYVDEPVPSAVTAVPWLILGLVLGAGISVMQWTILRCIIQGSKRWIWVSCPVWALGVYVTYGLWAQVVGYDESVFGPWLCAIAGVVLVGAATGLVLIWMLNHPQQSEN